jgi:hypothetical protein
MCGRVVWIAATRASWTAFGQSYGVATTMEQRVNRGVGSTSEPSHSRGRSYVRDGVMAGMIGAALVAVWFLIYDAAREQPFRTPALLGAAAFQGAPPPEVAASPAPVLHYTVLHGVVFALIGVLIAYLMASAEHQPAFHLLLLIGLFCFEVTFLALLAWLAPSLLTEVAWWAILVANVLAAAGMLAYLLARQGHRARALLRGRWWPVAREGLVAGMLGAVVVAFWFLLYDAAAGTPLRTPALLGAVLFEGLRNVHAVAITPSLVMKYTLVHGAAFLVFGWLAAALLDLSDREPRLLFAVFMLFCCFEVFFFGLIAVLAEWLFEALAWWTILVGNLLAALAMLGFLWGEHRIALRRFLSARE